MKATQMTLLYKGGSSQEIRDKIKTQCRNIEQEIREAFDEVQAGLCDDY